MFALAVFRCLSHGGGDGFGTGIRKKKNTNGYAMTLDLPDPERWENEWWLVVMGLAHTEVSWWPAVLWPIVYT